MPPIVPAPVVPAPAATAVLTTPPGPPPPGGIGGWLGGGRKRLEAENEQLRKALNRLTGMDPFAVATEAERLRAELATVQQQHTAALAELSQVRAQVVDTTEIAALQEVGIYEYQHPLADAVAYKAQLERLKDQIKAMARGDRAVQAATGWTVNGSTTAGTRMIKEYGKLMLRAYNAEADSCVLNVRPHRMHSTVDKLTKVVDTIARLGKTMGIAISPAYHRLRVQEIQLTADYRAKVEEEKERIREERERQREEAAAQREFEREKARLAKERAHYLAALTKLQARGDEAGVQEMQIKLTEIGEAISGVEAREANTRAGYVYVISNIGAFGDRIVKIGMTRRLDPEDRVRELGDASVPFKFDTHALIFSQDAVGLESKLHAALDDRRVNRVNTRREFFYAKPTDVRNLLHQLAGEHLLEFRETPEAIEWRASHPQPLAAPGTNE